MKTYAITGVAGHIGGLLAEKLAADPASRVVGIDIALPRRPDAFAFHACDIRDPRLAEALIAEKVDVLVHLAFYTHPEGDPREAESVNVEGTRNLLEAAARARVRRIVLASSTAVYGSHADNPVPLSENAPLRPNEDFYYSRHKAAQERLLGDFLRGRPETAAVVLRPCVLLGPHMNNPTGDALGGRLLVYIRGNTAPIQFLHEDDAVEAFRLAAAGEAQGVFNVAADGTLTYPEIARILGKPLLLLPFRLLAALAGLGKRLGVSPVGAVTLRFIRHPIVVDSGRFRDAFGFTPRYDTRRALTAFAHGK